MNRHGQRPPDEVVSFAEYQRLCRHSVGRPRDQLAHVHGSQRDVLRRSRHLSTHADYINEDAQAAPKVGQGTVQATATVTPLQRKAN
jgi:hypothetical protein